MPGVTPCLACISATPSDTSRRISSAIGCPLIIFADTVFYAPNLKMLNVIIHGSRAQSRACARAHRSRFGEALNAVPRPMKALSGAAADLRGGRPLPSGDAEYGVCALSHMRMPVERACLSPRLRLLSPRPIIEIALVVWRMATDKRLAPRPPGLRGSQAA